MIDEHHFRAFALHLGFSADSQEVSDVLHKTYGENGEAIRIDFSKQSIDYPKIHGFKVNRADTCNFSSSENAVVLECVHRLLEKGYKPQHIELDGASRMIVRPFYKQMRMRSVPVFHGPHRCFAFKR
jgi:type I restriction enzyme M protein